MEAVQAAHVRTQESQAPGTHASPRARRELLGIELRQIGLMVTTWVGFALLAVWLL